MGDDFHIPLPRDIARGKVTPPPRPSKPKGTKKSKGKDKKKSVDLKPWVVTPSAGYSYGMPSPIWHESHGLHVGGVFKHTKLLNRYGVGLQYEHRWTKRPLTATDRLSNVKGTSHTGHLVLQRETFTSPLLSSSNTIMFGLSQNITPKQTISTQDGGSVPVDAKSALGMTLTSFTEPLNIHATKWLSFSPFFGISVTDAKGDDFDGMRLLLGLNVRFSLGPKNTKTVNTEKKHKPGAFVLTHSVVSQGFKLAQQYYTGRISSDKETMERDISLGSGSPGNLTRVTAIELLNGALTIFNQGSEMNLYLSFDDSKGWWYLAAIAAGAGYLFGNGTGYKANGWASFAQGGRMGIFAKLRTPSLRKAMGEEKLKKETRKALWGSFGLDFGKAFLGGALVGAGVDTQITRGLVAGTTLSQAGISFMDIPGIRSSTSAQYMLMYYYGSTGTKGILGGLLLNKHFKDLNMGMETIFASPTLGGTEKKDGKFRNEPLPTMICASPGYQLRKKNWHIHAGVQSCIRQGGADGVVGSIGGHASAGFRIPVGTVKKTNLALTGTVSISGGWNFGGAEGKPRNSGFVMPGLSLGLEWGKNE